MSVTPFSISVSDEVLDDLRDRLRKTRWVDDFANDGWQYGANVAYLKSLCDDWANTFDWRAQERAMNRYGHFRTEIEGVPIHFIHVRGKGPNPKPLILSHGWPWTFWDFKKVIGPLSDPAAHGGDPDDAFDVVIPSLPGYAFSTPLRTTGINFWRTADLWVQLMERLGYPKFYAEGGDWGALVTQQLGHKYADRVLGLYIHLLLPLSILQDAGAAPEDYIGPEEQALLAKNQHFFSHEAGYHAVQCTKPQSLAVGMNDSPAGLAAWLVEKRRTWSHSNGDVESRFTRDELCTVATIYWVTQSFGTSARYYYECTHNPWKPSHDRWPVVEAPSALAYFDHEVANMPRAWCERYHNVKQYTRFPSGGHFAPMEEPEALVADMRTFFRTL